MHNYDEKGRRWAKKKKNTNTKQNTKPKALPDVSGCLQIFQNYLFIWIYNSYQAGY